MYDGELEEMVGQAADTSFWYKCVGSGMGVAVSD